MSEVWNRRGDAFYPGTTSSQSERLPPGLYRWGAQPGAWFLERFGDGFAFPYKVYGNHDHILIRVHRAWSELSGNLGVLLNGLKGTGKTVTAQLLANWAVESGCPVIVVSHPIPLADVLIAIKQDAVVLFDEFEKTHDAEAQQNLLTALDGMSRDAHRRLFVFTTNDRAINVNLLDRPSRVRYAWEFGRLTDQLVCDLMDDLLPKSLAHHRPDILAYLATRKVVSIDVAKTVIREVVTFNEAPSAFADVMNLSSMDPTGFSVDVIGPDGQVVRPMFDYFMPRNAMQQRMLSAATLPSGRADFMELIENHGGQYNFTSFDQCVTVVGAGPEGSCDWVCHVTARTSQTWMKDFPNVAAMFGSGARLDAPPPGWKVPGWAAKYERGKTLSESEEELMGTFCEQSTAHGTGVVAAFLLRFTPHYETVPVQIGHHLTY